MRRSKFILAPAIAIAACLLAAATTFVVNLPVFDEPLMAELEALKQARPPFIDQNAYPLAVGFLAANDVDPEIAGETLLQLLNERFEAGEAISFDAQQWRTLTGSTGQPEAWRTQFESLECVPRVELDCANQLLEEASGVNLADSRLNILFQRFEALTDKQRFDEGEQRDASSPFAPIGPIRNVSRILLAKSFAEETTGQFITRASSHFRFWKLVLRDADTLGVKMSAVAGIQDTLDFLSALMRERELSAGETQTILDAIVPLTREESDLSDAFLSEIRVQVLSDKLPMADGKPLLVRSTLQRNATLNEFHRRWIAPARQLARLSASEFHQQEGNRPFASSRLRFPLSPYNWSGKKLVHEMQWDPEQFVARTHDQNGRILLVRLQAEIERSPGVPVSTVLESSSHRNPYTGEPMSHDAGMQTIGFECLHTAYHPPALPDNCAARIQKNR